MAYETQIDRQMMEEMDEFVRLENTEQWAIPVYVSITLWEREIMPPEGLYQSSHDRYTNMLQELKSKIFGPKGSETTEYAYNEIVYFSAGFPVKKNGETEIDRVDLAALLYPDEADPFVVISYREEMDRALAM